MIHTLRREQLIPAAVGAVWDFFATPKNLDLLTPPGLKFFTPAPPEGRMYAGQLIAHRIRIFPGYWARWLTEIRQVREREYFVDEQRVGPYKFWYHEHHFRAAPGGTLMTDQITYQVCYGPLGWLVNELWIKRALRKIFDYRRGAIERAFGGGG
jgi:ligand-binding SRPBCC domain-containing protein